MSDQESPARPAGRTVVRKGKIKRWNEKRRQTFLAMLSETANVRRSARRVGLSKTAAYALKKRDPAFAQAWAEALEMGYSELEMTLLRQSVEGTERVERMNVGEEGELKYVKTVHSYPLTVAVRLFLAHRQEVLAYRQARDGVEEPRESAMERARKWIDEIRSRLAANEARLQAEKGE